MAQGKAFLPFLLAHLTFSVLLVLSIQVKLRYIKEVEEFSLYHSLFFTIYARRHLRPRFDERVGSSVGIGN